MSSTINFHVMSHIYQIVETDLCIESKVHLKGCIKYSETEKKPSRKSLHASFAGLKVDWLNSLFFGTAVGWFRFSMSQESNVHK